MSIFHCQQFSVRQQNTAMKVCSDSLLFGAMAQIQPGCKVLDIGSGSGLLTLMAAQLGAGHLTAVEISDSACKDAAHNFSASPWHTQFSLKQQDICSFPQLTTEKFDFIISNPPFFANHLQSSQSDRNLARHNNSLPYNSLIEVVDKLMSNTGFFYVLLPAHVNLEIETITQQAGLHRLNTIEIQSRPDKPAKLIALSFSRLPLASVKTKISLFDSNMQYSATAKHYLKSFLLRFKL